MDVDICRVCGETSKDMVNIFDGTARPEIRISIADMISLCTGHRISKGDPFSKTICAPCKRDATNAFEIKQLYETSHSVFCQIIKKDDLQEEEMLDISYSKIGRLRIKHEPVEEDIFEDVRLQFTEFEVDEEFKENAEDQEKSAKTSHICSYCKRSFSQKCNLQAHIRTHTGERPFKCPHCEKSCAKKGNLQKHIATHKAERPYHCSVCLKTFKTAKYLQSKSHLDTHKTLKKRPYKCSHCQRTFATNNPLQDHIRKIHNGDWPYKCSDCEKSFRLKRDLKEHKQTHDQKEDEL
ncbi:zinc finger protein Paris-like [Drosophila kikkawai]|uniref:Zinc finger protein Paris-like n=1 Tax=Drosophila kikkawai TaxID=30033 RepID=A0A6P4JAF0_DROKI|nr:zinc finger protein 525-like isoform X1 [Drosophila kikkawai]